MFTVWGYETSVDLPCLLSAADFDDMTGGRYAGDLRVGPALAAASQAVRNACGWHVAPSIGCTARLTAAGKMAKLPAGHVSAVSSVREYDPRTGEWAALSVPGQVEWRHDGLLRRLCFREFTRAWDGVEVTYTAGYDPCAAPDLMDAVRRIAEGVLSMPVGISSETAGGVSVSYSASASSIAASMTPQFMAQLAPYRLVSAHAA